MSIHSSEYPTIIKLKAVEKEITTAINEYKNLNKTLQKYMINEVWTGAVNYDEDYIDFYNQWWAQDWMPFNPSKKYGLAKNTDKNTIQHYKDQMEQQITVLKGLINKAKPILADIVSKGALNQDIVTFKQKDLMSLNDNLQEESNKLHLLQDEIFVADAENDNQSKQQYSYFIQIIFVSILAVIVIGLTVNAIVNPNSNSIETGILIIIAAIVAYFIYNKYA